MSKRYLQPHVHCSIIHKRQHRKTAQCPWEDELIKKMWCIHTVECHSVFEKEGNPAICSNTNELGGHL